MEWSQRLHLPSFWDLLRLHELCKDGTSFIGSLESVLHGKGIGLNPANVNVAIALVRWNMVDDALQLCLANQVRVGLFDHVFIVCYELFPLIE